MDALGIEHRVGLIALGICLHPETHRIMACAFSLYAPNPTSAFYTWAGIAPQVGWRTAWRCMLGAWIVGCVGGAAAFTTRAVGIVYTHI